MPTCPHCGHESDPGARECPLCGTRLSAPAGGEPPDGPPVPWEDPELGFVDGIGRTWTRSMLEPAAFFGRVRDEGTLVRPLIYFLLVTVLASVVTLVWDAAGLSLAGFTGYAEVGDVSATGAVVSFVLTPFLSVVVLLLTTVIFHLGALMVAPDRQGMGATAKVVCYSASPSVLAVVPVVGTMLGAVWTLALQVVGLREAHGTTTMRGLFMVFWLWIVLLVLGLVVAALVATLGTGGEETLVLSEALGRGAVGVGRAAGVPPAALAGV